MALDKLLQEPLPKAKPSSRPMKEIGAISDDGDFLNQSRLKKFVDDVNRLIKKYNSTAAKTRKKEILEAIQAQIKEIDYNYATVFLSDVPGYLAARDVLFTAIKDQYASLGINSVAPITKAPSPLPALSELIANMAPEKMNAFFNLLMNELRPLKEKKSNSNDDDNDVKLNPQLLENLYDKEDQSEEAELFREFLQNHEITFLGGGNSNNFKVTGLRGEAVLKIEDRMGMPRTNEVYLRGILASSLTSIYAEREVHYPTNYHNEKCNTILVTDYCALGSIDQFRFGRTTVEQIEEHIGTIFEQMAATLLDMQQANCIFPDAKISNWLIDDNEKIRIADTKSFALTNKQGQYYQYAEENKDHALIRTLNYDPPEAKSEIVSADQLHAYILGKNLYVYVTGEQHIAGHNADDFNFNHAFFNTSTGQEYKALIIGLVKEAPAQRMPMREALERLNQLAHPELNKIFTQLKAFKFGMRDTQMDEFIAAKQKLIARATPNEHDLILRDLAQTVEMLKKQNVITEVKSIINNFKDKAGVFTIGMHAKAKRIESAMAKLSIDERCNFFDSDNAQDVLQALASHRRLGKSGAVYKTPTGAIDEKKAARAFKDFKGKFKDKLHDLKEQEQENTKNTLNTPNKT
jgi:serine/threonine protein kinase